MSMTVPWRVIIDRRWGVSRIGRIGVRAMLAAGLCIEASNLAADASPEVAADSVRTLLQAGERIYHHGISTRNQPIVASVEGDVAITGQKIACVTCHQRSGLGTSEAAILIPPIAGIQLFSPRSPRNPFQSSLFTTDSAPGNRPAYRRDTLRRALRQGLDSSGRALDALMPRYELTDQDVDALTAYLNTLATEPDPGVDDDSIHFASVVMPDASPIQRNAMLDVLRAFFQDRNSATRHEPRRAGHAPWNKRWTAHAYRKWQLHIWELTGPAATWPAQLQRYYQQQPVFALLGGVGASEWQPVHVFCERHRIPCVFPSTDMPAANETGFYSLYFSQGLQLEAQALAAYIAQKGRPDADAADSRGIVQIYRNTTRGIYAARAFRQAIQKRGLTHIDDYIIDADESSARGKSAPSNTAAVIVYWLDADDLRLLASAASPGNEPPQRYFSSTLINAAAAEIPAILKSGGYLLHPFALNEQRQTQLLRTNLWLQRKDIAVSDQRIQADAYFVAMLTRGAVHQIQGNFSREYFVERIEHMVENTLSPSIYPRLSLGPGQRFASKGCYLVGLSELSAAAEQPVWIIP